ncbi:Isopenicillin N epimerase [Polystyrenella longa]|uniref:Isopenicillin N epimerase n=1 Tax=Polystyrenella longa TaxID=2528007 RepID=A0A518CT76_9PLAN|nr:aminotransferase class V-fold PLP-dependent enzyme [Polystyrenella longa]QDU82384.1 Isopenicillin N epimerase [Polystyrenella longa]
MWSGLKEYDLSPPWKKLWSLDPEVTYLNHGSFGPSPLPIQQAHQEHLQKIESQPSEFFFRTREEMLEQVTVRMAQFLGTKSDSLLLTSNATVAMNIVAQSLSLEPDDEVLLTNHEYGAVQNIWREACQQQGATFGMAQLPNSPMSTAELIDSLFERVTDRTRLIVLSHVTSPTSLCFPIKEICQRARQHDIAVCVDGPHALVMHPVQLNDLGCQFYTSSCHKWMSAPFGTGFLYVRGAFKSKLKPLMTSWGRSLSGRPKHWKDAFLWQGTDNDAAWLALSATLDFWNKVGTETFQQHSFPLAQQAADRISELFSIEPLSMASDDHRRSMVSIPIGEVPEGDKHIGQPDPLQARLLKDFGIEVPVIYWNGLKLLRVSTHLYTEQADIDKLIDALSQLRTAMV